MRIYLAGPMRGLPMFNFPAFMQAAMALRDLGHFVDSPAERDVAIGFNAGLPLEHPDNIEAFDLGEAFEWDFGAILKADAMVVLPNWHDSKGVQAEMVLAMALTRDIFEWVNDGSVWNLRPLLLDSYTVNFEWTATP